MLCRPVGILFLAIVAGVVWPVATVHAQAKATKRPNVIVIMADDMGHGDLGLHGNPIIRTPNLDRFARQSTRWQHFHVSPVCSPTRASLLTGRYNYRTGVVDTFIGRSMMHADEVTLAEMLAAAGYRTGIFGKWHLGDCYPLRPMDQGFHEALVHRGGGIGQPSDPPGGTSYFDPILFRNGQPVQTKGYCSDTFTDAAIDFVAKNRDRPFFLYLPYNAPHTPLQVPDRYYQLYNQKDLSPARFPAIGQPLAGKINDDDTARVYAMVTNLDDNLGRLFAKLDELNLAEDTIVIFLTDNGPQQVRYNSGMRGRKGTVHEGGTHVPFFVRWPSQFPADRLVDRIAAHIDVTPTLLELCGVRKPANVAFDGVSLAPLLRNPKVAWPDRTLYFQWHRGDVPQLYRAFAARSQRYRLVQPEGVPEKKETKQWTFQLYDIAKDPYEQHDLAQQQPEIVARMKKDYEAWFKDVAATRQFAPPRIHLGSAKANPVVLTRQDWRGPQAGWGPENVGHWEVLVEKAGTFDITLTLPPKAPAGTARLKLGDVAVAKEVPAGTREVVLSAVQLPAGAGRLQAWLATDKQTSGMAFVEIRGK